MLNNRFVVTAVLMLPTSSRLNAHPSGTKKLLGVREVHYVHHCLID